MSNEITLKTLKEVHNVGTDIALAKKLNISVDTVRSWKKRGVPSWLQAETLQNAPQKELKPLHVKEIEYHLSAKEKEMIMAYRNVNEITQREIYHLIMLKEIEATKAGELSELKAV